MPCSVSFEPALSQVGVLHPCSKVHSLFVASPSMDDADSLFVGVGSKHPGGHVHRRTRLVASILPKIYRCIKPERLLPSSLV